MVIKQSYDTLSSSRNCYCPGTGTEWDWTWTQTWGVFPTELGLRTPLA